MNIAFIGYYAENATSGVLTTGYSMAKALMTLGHQVFFYYPAEEVRCEKDEFGIISRTFLQRRSFQLPAGMREHIRQNPDQIDVFHIHSVFYFFNTLSALAIHAAGLPYVHMPHGGYNKNILARKPLLKRAYRFFLEDRYVRQASSVFCIAEREAEDLRTFRYRGKVKVVHNLVDEVPIPTANADAALPPRTLLYLGRYDRQHKGLDTLLHIFKAINALDDTIHLQLHGEGPDRQALEDLAKQLELKNFSLQGSIYGEAKYQALRDATVFALPSRWEAFGTAAVEAAMMRLPVVVTPGYYMTPFFVKHDLGIVLEDDTSRAAAQVVQFMDDEARLQDIRSRNRETILAHFSPPVIGRLLIEGYQEALSP